MMPSTDAAGCRLVPRRPALKGQDMRKAFYAVAGLLALSACAAAAAPEAVAASDPPPHVAAAPAAVAPAVVVPVEPTRYAPPSVWCDIRVTPTAQGVRFAPVARSDDAISGEFSFVLTRSDANGSSDITQGGAFSLARAERTTLGSADLSMGRGARYRALLVMENRAGVVCRREVGS